MHVNLLLMKNSKFLFLKGTNLVSECLRRTYWSGGSTIESAFRDASGTIPSVFAHLLTWTNEKFIDPQTLIETWGIRHHKPMKASPDDDSLLQLINFQQNVCT